MKYKREVANARTGKSPDFQVRPGRGVDSRSEGRELGMSMEVGNQPLPVLPLNWMVGFIDLTMGPFSKEKAKLLWGKSLYLDLTMLCATGSTKSSKGHWVVSVGVPEWTFFIFILEGQGLKGSND